MAYLVLRGHGRSRISTLLRTKALSINGEIYNYKHLMTTLKDETPFRTASDCEVGRIAVRIIKSIEKNFFFHKSACGLRWRESNVKYCVNKTQGKGLPLSCCIHQSLASA
jgi:hypothetical protein